MSARRQSSTTSLAKYARTTSPDVSARSFDFCNAFWGAADGGVDVLFARMRGAARTMEELRNFWKERSSIEEDYAKRLAKLAKMAIGKDEIGELRNSIDTLRLETDKHAGYHSQLAQQIRTDLEGQVGAFVSKQQHHKKVYQAAIEKEFKVKQTREQHASKAREKYESDCLRINSYTAQSTLVQGKDLEKINLKLERAQQTVQVNESDYAQFTRVLQETLQKWEQDWKAFCDTCQDLEEERMEFMKDNMWAYANAVSTVCVSDDESCEKMRLALEQLEPEKDMENFVRDYGTGNAIPEHPMFVNYANTDAPPVSSTRVITRPSNFARVSQRATRAAPLAQDEEPYDDTNHAGVGAGGIGGPPHNAPTDARPLSRSATQKSTSPQVRTNGINGHVSPSRDPQRRQSTASVIIKPNSAGDPVDPTVTKTQMVIGNRAWDVDPDKDPQQHKANPRTSPPVAEQDPLLEQMNELNAAAASSGPTRKNTIRDGPPPLAASRKGTIDSLSTPSKTPPAPRDFRNSAEMVVGVHPQVQSHSRSASPNPMVRAPPPSISQTTSSPPEILVSSHQRLHSTSPTPTAMMAMAPQPPITSATSSVPVEMIVSGYQRPFPGEPRSRANSIVGPPPVVNANPDPNVPRPTSRAGYPGVGTQQALVQRPTSPAKGPSPTALQPYNRVPPASGVSPANPSINANGVPLHRGMSVSQQRPVTPTNAIGIALGSDGRVVHDMMVRQPHYQPAPPPPPQPQQTQAPPPPQTYGYDRALTHAQAQPPPPPAVRNDYVVPANAYPGGQTYGPPQGYDYHPHGHGQYAHPQAAPQQQPPPPPQPAYNNGYGQVARPGYHHQQQQNVGHVATRGHNGNAPGNAVYRAPSPGVRSPSPMGHGPPPTGTYTDAGRPILFYVKALYDYTATIDEEFDFQAGDIIAVTDTPEDGWWSGELLDDTRRQAGRHVFPSNFVCLF